MSDQGKAILLMVKGSISELSEIEQRKVKEHAQYFRDLLASDQLAMIAFALVGCEMSAV